ncbi:Predicted metalloprotease [Actinobacillus equuli]|nr:Predicted metalloprotease [Actinobacillus equuli]
MFGVIKFKRREIRSRDVEEAFIASQAVGDDRLQKQAQGYIVPDSFTHGSSAERLAWFRKGLQSGNPAVCDTFLFVKLQRNLVLVK